MTHAYVGDANQISSRFEDQDGRLFVGPSVITKAGIDDYRGREIHNWQTIGLDPERTYRLFRAPDELARAAPLLRNQPVLSEHAPLTADDHKSDLTIGAIGSDPEFRDDCLTASLAVWRQPFIDRIKSGSQREISMGYRFRPDMTPGTWNGRPYDGVMRDIKPNHVAVVPAGRVNINGDGPLAAVADSATGAEPLAEDPEDDKKKAPPAGTGDEGADGGGDTPEPGTATANDEDETEEEKKKKKGEGEASDEGEKKPCAGDEGGDKPGDKDKGGTAMDAAAITASVTTALRAQFRAAHEAREEVRPVVGALSMAMDSADEIYGAALRQKGVDTKGVHPSAYAGMWKALKPSFARPAAGMAMDSATAAARTASADRLGAGRIKRLG